MQPLDESPSWLQPLLNAVESDPLRRWTDADIRVLNLEPERVRRWFKQHHGMTFHAYSRSRRLGGALGAMQSGEAEAHAAFDHGFESLSGFRSAIERMTGVVTGNAAEKGAARLFRRQATLIQRARGFARHRVSRAGVACLVGHCLRNDCILRGSFKGYRQSGSGSRCGSRKWRQSDGHSHSMSPNDRFQWIADRVWRGIAPETISVGARARCQIAGTF